MGREDVAEVHLIDLIAREDQDLGSAGLAKASEILADGVGGAFVPGALDAVLGRLLRGEDLDEASRETVEVVALRDVAMERRRVELRKDVDPDQTRVDAVRDRDVDEPELSAERNRRLRAQERQRVEARSRSSPHDHARDVIVDELCLLHTTTPQPARSP